MHRLRLVIRGRVQGVGFRYFVASRARELGVSGSVRNDDATGAVELHAEGDRERLLELLEAVRVGPTAARVAAVEEEWSEGPGRFRGFQVVP